MRTTTKMSSRPVFLLFLFILVVAGVLVGFGVPLVSSEGMIIRARLVEGPLPTEPEDDAWAKVSPDDASIERTGHYQTGLAGADRASLDGAVAPQRRPKLPFCLNGRTTRRTTV